MVRPEVALAQGLVERLAPFLPEPLVLQAKGSVVRASCPNDLWTEKDLRLIVNQSGSLGTGLESASERALDMVQDFVILNTQVPWPVPEIGGSIEGSYLPLPGSIDGGANPPPLVRGTIRPDY